MWTGAAAADVGGTKNENLLIISIFRSCFFLIFLYKVIIMSVTDDIASNWRGPFFYNQLYISYTLYLHLKANKNADRPHKEMIDHLIFSWSSGFLLMIWLLFCCCCCLWFQSYGCAS